MTLTDLKRIAEATPEWSSVTRLSPALCLALVAVAEAADGHYDHAMNCERNHDFHRACTCSAEKLDKLRAHLDRLLAEDL